MGGDARPVRLLGGGSVVLSRLGGGEVREEGHVVKRKEGYMCKGREKKGTVESTGLSGRA